MNRKAHVYLSTSYINNSSNDITEFFYEKAEMNRFILDLSFVFNNAITYLNGDFCSHHVLKADASPNLYSNSRFINNDFNSRKRSYEFIFTIDFHFNNHTEPSGLQIRHYNDNNSRINAQNFYNRINLSYQKIGTPRRGLRLGDPNGYVYLTKPLAFIVMLGSVGNQNDISNMSNVQKRHFIAYDIVRAINDFCGLSWQPKNESFKKCFEFKQFDIPKIIKPVIIPEPEPEKNIIKIPYPIALNKASNSKHILNIKNTLNFLSPDFQNWNSVDTFESLMDQYNIRACQYNVKSNSILYVLKNIQDVVRDAGGTVFNTDKYLGISENIKQTCPTGNIRLFPFKNPPEGYLLCDGGSVETIKYENLAKKIYGEKYEEDTFKVPKLKHFSSILKTHAYYIIKT